jgi:hypothetical protein
MVNKKTILNNLKQRCESKSHLNGDDLNIYKEMYKVKTILNEWDDVQEAIFFIVADYVFTVNVGEREKQEYYKILELNGYL